MGERASIDRAGELPVTAARMREDLTALGVAAGMTLLVHTALSRLGWVAGGPQAVIMALQELLGPAGTLVMPAHSSHLSDPAAWRHPPVPEPWWPIIRDETPAYDPDLTPTRQMGAVAETFRKGRGVLRSAHPQASFAAWGAEAARVTSGHTLEVGLGEGSPLAHIYALGGHVLLLGVGHGNNTSLHLAEYRAGYPGKRMIRAGAPMLVGGERRWVEFDDIDWSDEDFPAIGADFARETGLERSGGVGQATALLMPQHPLIDYAVGWMERNRR
ncbi:AAC(3) family N-acetyltransferase [Oscillochloris sp. ZM17-4]|uniref:aminoglycoside N(3)-acetyltransferase n=1 Tax=Oscillochloris sp. ZM17-4 TaxID=2866714 RepID=UPI001C736EDD|nr:AAC(3) family N-acetyltransferase [Oscillochloris sp. ZM17-4]MBX0326460.1 AAC(3) family N-acetyltransferase [Oscillochloris sp. ZM17-4]